MECCHCGRKLKYPLILFRNCKLISVIKAEAGIIKELDKMQSCLIIGGIWNTLSCF
jgi:hypothetical protein